MRHDAGCKQADLTGQRLKHLGVPFTLLVHSTMPRAVETAQLIHKHLQPVKLLPCQLVREGAPVRPDPALDSWRPDAQFFEDGARIEAGFRKYFYRADPGQQVDSHEIIVCHANVIRYWVCRRSRKDRPLLLSTVVPHDFATRGAKAVREPVTCVGLPPGQTEPVAGTWVCPRGACAGRVT
ncbi:hypothetical protein HPB48_010226 [Haemaphysalis longicornis]|uniref:Serine/threonine-protein phosphatase PGAM5, mitochondrial n=1 Tax=Haemaphysalis longicornis TaxID=44386 RepID=A0A9J6GF18_HAELO|nr:hypothetical protein HPB48_010226 [Haemaphysalis longicornis]